jgi:type IV pilus assembly protein PilY1
MRGLALTVIWAMVLQPAVSSAALSQQPLFTVTSVPPNVMLMFDDSASMNQLTLKTAPGMLPTTISLPIGASAAVKMNTAGYYGISGVRFYAANDPAYDGHWNFSVADIMLRAAAFNPLAYNPATQYLPWNNNGTRMQQSFYGGNTNVATGALTQWDMRNLPSGATVRSKLSAPNSGVIVGAGATRSWVGPTGSVRYDGFSTGAAEGADLFTGTVTFRDPNCNTTTSYGWTCPAGTAAAPPLDVCGAGNVGLSSASGTCCTSVTPGTPFADTRPNYRDIEYGVGLYPNGSPPAMTGPLGETCNSISWRSIRSVNLGTNCVTPPPRIVVCGGGGGELCTVQDPAVCDMGDRNTWRCDYTESFTNYTASVCNTTVARICSVTGAPCSGYNPPTLTGPAENAGGYFTPARYFVYDGPGTRTSAEVRDLSNYRAILVDRNFGWNGGTSTRDLDASTGVANAVSKWYVVDAASGLPSYRSDCAVNAGQDGTWCTFEQEAQNYSNWYTYYRSRLFAAVGVLSEVFANFTGPEQFLRIGYGRINNFPGARNPWNTSSLTDILGGLPALDGATNEGGVERGVRPFTVFDPPNSATPNASRAQVFDWLFSINGMGPTPNRESLHGAGLYFARNDSTGPWADTPGSGSQAAADHLWCRRNYTVLATDGEWTRLPTTAGFTPQRLLERAGDFSTLDPLLAADVSRSVNRDGPMMAGTDRLSNAPLSFQYLVASEPQISGGSGATQTETLTDVLFYYWSRDLRSDLRNSIDPSPKNRAFWQHMVTFVVGYGVNASMDDPTASPTLRAKFDARNSITWPTVGLEDCRQLDDNVADAAIPNRPPCTLTVTPSGNRINDTLRGALSSGGDFFSANSPAALRSALDAVFSAINAENASGTAPGLSSSSVGAGNVIVQSGFFTNTWEGYVQAFDQVALVNFLISGGVAPTPAWLLNFPAPASRNIYTSTAINTPVTFDWGSLTVAQKTSLDVANLASASSPVLDYLRGVTTGELRNGGTFRNRFNTILGDVVNSTPLYSKASDFAYQLQPAGSFTLPNTSTQGYSTYRAYIGNKQTTRHPVVAVGSNNGMLHIVDARTGQATSGQEQFAFVPRALFSNLRDLSLPAYSHRYYVDGPIIEGDVWNGSAWKTIAIGTTGAGRQGVFAIDITAPESGFTSANVLWDIVPAEHSDADVQNHLGNILSPGYIGSVRDSAAPNGQGRFVYIVGNGYESVRKEATLLIFDALTGALIKAIKTGVGNNANPNGLGAITPIYDGSRNIIAIYAGDLQGNLWKFDLSSSTINDPDGGGPLKGWEIYNRSGPSAPLFVATDSSNAVQPITSEPRVSLHPVGGLYVAFGTGKMFESTDPASTQVQSIYVLWDRGQIAPILKTELESITLQEFPFDHDANAATPDELFRKLKASDLANYDWNDKGFYIPLIKEGGPADGERVLAAPILDGGVVAFTTFAPTSGIDQCVPGGASYLYRLNLAGGLDQSGFLNVANAVGRRIQPGLVSSAPPLHDPIDPTGTIVDSMSAADVQTMMQNPKYRLSGNRAVQQSATGTCAHVGLRVDGTMARVPTVCAGLMPMRSWRPVR